MTMSQALFGPSPALATELERQRARLLAGFSLAEGIVMVGSAVQAWFLAEPHVSAVLTPLLLVGALLCFGLYALARSARLRLALNASIAFNWLVPAAVLAVGVDGFKVFDTAAWFVTSILFTGIFAGRRATLVVGIAAALVPVACAALFPSLRGVGPAPYEVVHAVMFVGHLTLLTFLLSWQRAKDERFRRAELVARNEELLALKGSLEERVEERTADLRESHADLGRAYEELRRSQESMLAQEKMASLGRLTAGLAHEMNSPVAAARASLAEAQGLADEYERSIGEPGVTETDHRAIAAEMKRAIELGLKAAERAATFLHSIKSQTRDLGKAERRPFDAVSSIRDTLQMLGHEAKSSKCRVRFEPGADRIDLVGAPGRFTQVVTNLVTNAFDASAERGGGEVRVRLDREAEEVVLSVADDGPGIAPEIKAHLFEPLFTTKPVGKGTGLGLTIVRDIVDGHFQGRIDVQSVPGRGAEFVVRLPQAA